jgi:hypothetical protein
MGTKQSSPKIAPQDDQYSSSTSGLDCARHAAWTFIFTFGKVDGGRKFIFSNVVYGRVAYEIDVCTYEILPYVCICTCASQQNGTAYRRGALGYGVRV